MLVLAPAAPAVAQVAVQCGCYCGITLPPPCSEQAFKTACGYSSGEGNTGRPSGPTELWYCRAVAPNGAWGWAHSSSQGWARQAALNECRKLAAGCTVEACRINDASLTQAPAYVPQPGQGQAVPQEAWCDLCTRKLQNDIYSGWASALVRSYVGQAIAGYQNCRQKFAPAGGSCPSGDAMVKRLQLCAPNLFDRYRQCLTIAAQLDQ